MATVIPYKGKGFALRIKGFWELCEVDLALTLDGKLLKEIGIPVHMLDEVIAAMQRERQATLLQADENFNEWCKCNEARHIAGEVQWGPL